MYSTAQYIFTVSHLIHYNPCIVTVQEFHCSHSLVDRKRMCVEAYLANDKIKSRPVFQCSRERLLSLVNIWRLQLEEQDQIPAYDAVIFATQDV